MRWDDPLSEASWVPSRIARGLQKLGLITLGDLIEHYPRRHEDRTRFDYFPDGATDTPVCLRGIVAATSHRRLGGWKRMFEVVLEDPRYGGIGPRITCRWFNAPYVDKMIYNGAEVIVYGRAKIKGAKSRSIVIDHPEFEVCEPDGDASLHMERIVPVHPAGEGVSVRVLRALIHRALSEMEEGSVPCILPQELDPSPRTQALRAIHFPDSFEALEKARRRLVLEEFFTLQSALVARKRQRENSPGAARPAQGDLVEKFLSSLPFPLTGAQRRAITELRADLAAPRPMHRLLQGDVGSGKTVTAAAAMVHAVDAGWQAALMAPTQILAEQHYRTLKNWLDPLGIRVALHTGTRREGTEPGGSLFGDPQIIIGTHALLYEGAEFSRLGLVVIDEQHKFGVMQRAALMARGNTPDLLVMTATPIPRTLTLSLYGDLDISILDEMPANRKPITTAARGADKLADAAKFLREKLDLGRQAYIVYPLIEQSERLEAKAASVEHSKWRELLAPHTVELLHGRTPPEERERIMHAFRVGDVAALVSTTVIEVGVDVPNATVMLIENAERFGLAQLHQLRGRIGRGAHKSYCILLAGTNDPEDIEKLAILERTANGFEIAEEDLRLRGPGDLLGTAQTGLPPLKLGNIIRDAALMRQARDAALAQRDLILSSRIPGHAGG